MTTLISDSKPKARKAHVCHLCGGPVKVGEVYYRATLVWDGRLYDWVECPGCRADRVLIEVSAWTGGYYDEGVGIDQADEWAHENADYTEDSGPMARRWLARNGCDCEACETRVIPPASTEGGAQ